MPISTQNTVKAYINAALVVKGDDITQNPDISAAFSYEMAVDESLDITSKVAAAGSKTINLPANTRILYIHSDQPVKITANTVANTWAINGVFLTTVNKDMTALDIVNDGTDEATIRVIAIQVKAQ